MYTLNDYDYHLPEDCISQHPHARRDQARLLILDRKTGERLHRVFHQVVDFLNPDDVLVVNNTRVIPARLFGKKQTGGRVEILILDYPGGLSAMQEKGFFESPCMVRAAKRIKPEDNITFAGGVQGQLLRNAQGDCRIRFQATPTFETWLEETGKVPLPPYIRRHADDDDGPDRNDYQTVYAAHKGAVAAPTAGLHFTRALLDRIRAKGVSIAEITLHVGHGTFLPVRVDDIREHHMHAERFVIPSAAAETISRAKAEGRRLIAVGTTAVRTLEYAADADGRITKHAGQCDLFIYPGYRFKMVDAMITNFHLPKSTLLMLVSAFAGRESILNAYREAIREGYRFFSYGDAMLIH